MKHNLPKGPGCFHAIGGTAFHARIMLTSRPLVRWAHCQGRLWVYDENHPIINVNDIYGWLLRNGFHMSCE